jgi:hypothetical protein
MGGRGFGQSVPIRSGSAGSLKSASSASETRPPWPVDRTPFRPTPQSQHKTALGLSMSRRTADRSNYKQSTPTTPRRWAGRSRDGKRAGRVWRRCGGHAARTLRCRLRCAGGECAERPRLVFAPPSDTPPTMSGGGASSIYLSRQSCLALSSAMEDSEPRNDIRRCLIRVRSTA